MEDKKNPKTNKDENVGIACEPPVSYAATGSGYVNTIESLEEEIGISDDVDSGIGPYSMEELNARIDEAEAAITRSEHGDWSDWVTSKEMDQNLYAMFPWLQLSTSLTSGTQG